MSVPRTSRSSRSTSPRSWRRATGATRRHSRTEALELLVKAKWPGNVRQLYNVVEQSIALCPTEIIPQAFVEQAIQVEMHEMTSFEDARKRFERDYLTRILKLTKGSVTQAAKLARRNRTEFYKLLQRHGIEGRVQGRLESRREVAPYRVSVSPIGDTAFTRKINELEPVTGPPTVAGLRRSSAHGDKRQDRFWN